VEGRSAADHGRREGRCVVKIPDHVVVINPVEVAGFCLAVGFTVVIFAVYGVAYFIDWREARKDRKGRDK